MILLNRTNLWINRNICQESDLIRVTALFPECTLLYSLPFLQKQSAKTKNNIPVFFLVVFFLFLAINGYWGLTDQTSTVICRLLSGDHKHILVKISVPREAQCEAEIKQTCSGLLPIGKKVYHVGISIFVKWIKSTTESESQLKNWTLLRMSFWTHSYPKFLYRLCKSKMASLTLRMTLIYHLQRVLNV